MKISTVATTLVASAACWPLVVCAAGDGPGVQLYGVVDAGIATTHTSGQGTHNGVLNGGLTDSLWGLRGSEDLGDGWATRFQLESGFDPATGKRADDDRLFNYGAWVGLAHERYGDLRLGRQYTVGKTYGNALELASWKEMGMGATFKASDNYQFSNLVNYYTPTWQGFQAGIGYSFDADGRDRFKTAANNRALSLGLKYEDGPLLAVATWDQLRLAEPPAGQAGRPQAVQLGRPTTSRSSRYRWPGPASATVMSGWTAAIPTAWARTWGRRPLRAAAPSTPGCWAPACRWAMAPWWRSGRWRAPTGNGRMGRRRAMRNW